MTLLPDSDSQCLLVRQDNSRAERYPIGGKARALWQLQQAGFPTSPWFALTPEAFRQTADIALLSQLENNNQQDEPDASLTARITLPPELSQIIRTTATDIGTPGCLWAVRSSAASEDSATDSFAGQLDSFLDIPLQELEAAVIRVWLSGFSPRVKAYRKARNLTGPPDPPAVLIQQMVPAEWAGVAFSADPVTGNRSLVTIAVVAGLAEKLVSGEEEGLRFSIDRKGNITDGDSALTSKPPLALLRQVAETTRAVASAFGRAQDVEWACANDRLYILQSRPISTLGQIHDPNGTRLLWDDSNIAESYSGVTTPMTFSFARYIYEEVYRQFCHVLSVPKDRIARNDTVFAQMLGLIHGRIYYNLLSWYKVLALLPGFRLNQRFMEQMMGVKESLPQECLKDIRNTGTTGKISDAFSFAKMITSLIWQDIRLPYTRKNYYTRMNQALALSRENLKELSADQLAAHYRNLERQLLKHWDAPLINDFLAMIFFGLLRSLCGKWLGPEHALLANGLVSSNGGMVSAEPAERIHQMAAIASAIPALTQLLRKGTAAEINARRHEFPDLMAQIDAYLERFGDRCMEELKLESSTLRDDPTPLYRSIGTLADSPKTTVRENNYNALEEADAVVRAKLSHRPVARLIFKAIQNSARKRLRDRENLRLERTRLFGHVRSILIETGKRLVEVNQLHHPRDIFYLTIEEVLAYIEGTSVTTDLSALVELRRLEFERYQSQPTPPAGRFETRGMVYVGNRFQVPATTSAGSADDLRGTPCCPGIIRGTVRRVEHPANAEIQHGEILVAARTDPGWVLLFPSAAGLLVEHGSLLSHSAIVARELGLPAIVSIPNLMARLKSGDIIEMDGSTGQITLLNHDK